MIRSVGFDQARSILEIEFQSGNVYQYRGVSPDVYDELLSAASKGSYFEAHIKNAGFAFQRVV
ncbi:MAG: KTSC domain-containing protein [Chthoniobacterales bacterium]